MGSYEQIKTLTESPSKRGRIFSHVSLLQSGNTVQYFTSSTPKALLCFLLQNSVASSRRKSSGVSCELLKGEKWVAGFSSQHVASRQAVTVLSFLTWSLTFPRSCFKRAEHKNDPEECDLKHFPPFSTRRVSRLQCRSVTSNHGSVLATREWWDKGLASSRLEKEDLECTLPPPHLTPLIPCSLIWVEEGEYGKLGSARSLPRRKRLPGAVRSWAGLWFKAQQHPHPCRAKRVSKPSPGCSRLQMSQELLLPSVSV